MLAFLPFCGLWIWRQRYRRGLPSVSGVALASAVFFLVLIPWVVRNYEVFVDLSFFAMTSDCKFA